jgi:hypothetical protein
MVRRCWKHSRQNTGRPWVGLKGTVVSFPHTEHTACVSTGATAVAHTGAAFNVPLAAFGFVLELLIVERLLAGGK